MKALILAAGVGKRLGQSGEASPKCLLEFGGISLLERHLTFLGELGVDRVAIAVGYQDRAIQNAIAALGANNWVKTVYNPDYEQGSVVSLWTLREYLTAGDDLLLMDADVLYDRRIIERLVKTDLANCFLLDRNFIPGEEPVKLCVKGDRLVEFRKQIAQELDYDFAGESVGFFRFDAEIARQLAQSTESYIEHGKREEPYEESIRDLLLDTPTKFGYEEIAGLPWIEIDFPEDIQRAQDEILPLLDPVNSNQ
jgi:choline kinase